VTRLLEIDGLTRQFRSSGVQGRKRDSATLALDAVSLNMRPGESLGIVGESGSGKTTLARLVMALDRPSAGTVRLRGEDLFGASPARLRELRRHMQMVFQDPYGSLDPRHRVQRILEEPLIGLGIDRHRGSRRERVREALLSVGLRGEDGRRFPHEFSGGQRQRIAIARALIVRPALVVADEPVSALDMSIQAQILNLMKDLQSSQSVTYLFISHDLSVVRHITKRVAVLYRGRLVEAGPTETVFSNPKHPYTRALLDAVPRRSAALSGNRLRDRNVRPERHAYIPPSTVDIGR